MGTNLRSQRRNLYSKEILKQEKFFLSAVIVHMGQAGAGHYWVKNIILKFIDFF